jgi:hypothetical protein
MLDTPNDSMIAIAIAIILFIFFITPLSEMLIPLNTACGPGRQQYIKQTDVFKKRKPGLYLSGI